MSTELTVKQRNALFEDMDPITKQVAMSGIEKLQKGFKADLLVRYDVGELINKIFTANHLDDNQKKEELNKLADYWGQTSLSLYDLRNVAIAFTRQFLVEQVEEGMSNGNYLTWSHFRELQKVKETKRLGILKKVRQNNLSAKELALELQGNRENTHMRGGGRNPGIPKTPIAMLQKLFTTVQQTDNYLVALQEPLETLFSQEDSEASVDNKLIENIATTMERVDMTIENLQKTRSHLDAVRSKAMHLSEHTAMAAKKSGDSPEESEAPKRKRGRPKKENAEETIEKSDEF